MRKLLGFILLILLLCVGVYYYYSNTNRDKPLGLRSIEHCIPDDAEIILKLDLSKHKFTLLKEMLKFDPSPTDNSLNINNSLIDFAKEVVIKAGGGIALFEPAYIYKQSDNTWGALIYLADKVAFDSLLHQSNNITILSDSLFQIKESEWRISLESSFIHLYPHPITEVSEGTKWDLKKLDAPSGLISGLIKLQEGIVFSTIDYHKGEWTINATLPLKDDTIRERKFTQKLVSSEAAYLDFFITNPQSSYLTYLPKKSKVASELISQLKRPIHIQYLGKETKTEKYVTYEYNDDFEMAEVVKVQQKEQEKLRALFRLTSDADEDNLKHDFKAFFSNFSVTDSFLVASHQPITSNTEIESADSLYAQLIIKNLESNLPKTLANQLGEEKLILPFSIFNCQVYYSTDNTLKLKSVITMKDDFKGLFGIKKYVNQTSK